MALQQQESTWFRSGEQKKLPARHYPTRIVGHGGASPGCVHRGRGGERRVSSDGRGTWDSFDFPGYMTREPVRYKPFTRPTAVARPDPKTQS